MAELAKVEPAKTEFQKREIPKVELKFKAGALTPAELLTFGILPPEPTKSPAEKIDLDSDDHH